MKDLKLNRRRSACDGPRNYNEGRVQSTFYPARRPSSAFSTLAGGGVIGSAGIRPCWMVTCEVLHLALQGLILAHTPCPSLQQLMVTAWTSQCLPNFH